MKVDVEGAVVAPGVYSVVVDARVQDALIAAGGLSGNADREWVAQHIDLALKLTDGTKLYIPLLGEVAANNFLPSDQNGVGSAGDVLGASISQQTNINTASPSELDALPGIGPATVQKIISGRPYASTQDLVTNKVVSQKEFDKIKDLIIVE